MSYRGKPLYEQRMWNTIYISVITLLIFIWTFLWSIGNIIYSLENDDNIRLIIGIIFSIIAIFFIIPVSISIKFSKYKIYYHGIVVPAGLKKQKIWERFYYFKDIESIKIKGKNYIYFKIGKKKIGGHYWKSDQRDKFISIFTETKNKYLEKHKS